MLGFKMESFSVFRPYNLEAKRFTKMNIKLKFLFNSESLKLNNVMKRKVCTHYKTGFFTRYLQLCRNIGPKHNTAVTLHLFINNLKTSKTTKVYIRQQVILYILVFVAKLQPSRVPFVKLDVPSAVRCPGHRVVKLIKVYPQWRLNTHKSKVTAQCFMFCLYLVVSFLHASASTHGTER